MFVYLPLPTLPKVPHHFVDIARQALTDLSISDEVSKHIPNINSYENRKLLINGKETNTLRLVGKKLGDEWEQWVKENIIEEFINTGVRIAVGENTTTHGVHCDFVPNVKEPIYKFYYLLDDGGDAETVFYKQNGCNFERHPSESPDGTCLTVLDYSQVSEVARFKIPTNQWTLLNTSIMHGVENTAAGKRAHLTILVKSSSVKLGLIK